MEKENKSRVRELYITPDIEVVLIEIEQNILADGSGDAPNMSPSDW